MKFVGNNSYVDDKNMLYFYCVTQCFSLSLITHKLKLKITDIIVAFSRILRGVISSIFLNLLAIRGRLRLKQSRADIVCFACQSSGPNSFNHSEIMLEYGSWKSFEV